MELLGSGTNTAAVSVRGGGRVLFDLDGVTELEWGRTLDATTEATATIAASADPRCLDLLRDVHPWGCELTVFREGVRVYEGPIRRVSSTRSGVRLSALDPVGWLTRRRIRTKRVLRAAAEVGVTTEMETTITRALSPDDPNLLDYLFVLSHDEEATVTRRVKANSGYYYDDLVSLAAEGGHFTTLGRRILVFPDERAPGRLADLDADTHLLADVEVSEEGDELATRYTATNTEGLASTVDATVAGGAGPVDEYYGLHDRLSDQSSTPHLAGLERVATRGIRAAYPTPVVLTVPAGAGLAPTAPVSLAQLVPGVLVGVAARSLLVAAADVMMLTEVKVKQTASGEEVTITLAPPPRVLDVGATL